METKSKNDILFISDLHLSDKRPDLNKAFVDFCSTKVINAKRLYILGDLFDAWIGDDNSSITANLVIDQLKNLNLNNVEVFFMHGNRDFLVGNHFEKMTCCNILPDPYIINEFNKKILLMHGDSLCTDDEEYILFRDHIRQENVKKEILSKTIEERIKLAKDLRNKSKSANATKTEDIMDASDTTVLNKMKEHNVKILIHGHTHRPMVHEVSKINGLRYVLGDWDTKGWYIKLNSSKLDLLSFDIS